MSTYSLANRLHRSQGVLKNSWQVISGAKPLLYLPLLWMLINMLLFGLYLILGMRARFESGASGFGVYPHYDVIAAVSFVVYAAVTTVANIFIAGVAADNVLARFGGQPATLASSFKAAWRRKKSLAIYAIANSVVSYLVVVLLEKIPYFGKVLGWFGGVSWGAANLFSVPIIMRHQGETSPKRAVGDSVTTLKQLWEAGLATQLALGLILVLGVVVWYVAWAVIGNMIDLVIGINATGGMLLFGVASLVLVYGVFCIELVSLITRCALLHRLETGKSPAAYDTDIFKASMTAAKAKKLFE